MPTKSLKNLKNASYYKIHEAVRSAYLKCWPNKIEEPKILVYYKVAELKIYTTNSESVSGILKPDSCSLYSFFRTSYFNEF